MSGPAIHEHDARVVLGMEARGDRIHDIAAWFGVNQARIATVKSGDFANIEPAPPAELPPIGPPGLKGRRIRAAAAAAIQALNGHGDSRTEIACTILSAAIIRYDSDET